MGLQLRVKHALGTRMVEVPERGVDRPIAVGRDTSCEVQVPSGAVASVHCLLWQQDGEWVVQDNETEAGTTVNGELVTGPVFVQMGDVISLGGTGAAAPTIEVDPLGVARRASGVRAATLRPTAPAAGSAGQPVTPSAGWDQPAEQAVPAADPYAQEPAGGDEQWDLVNAGPAPTGPVRVTRPRGRPQSNTTGLWVGIGLAIAVVGGILIYSLKDRHAQQEKKVKAAEVERKKQEALDYGPGGPKGSGRNIFDDVNNQGKQAPKKQSLGPTTTKAVPQTQVAIVAGPERPGFREVPVDDDGNDKPIPPPDDVKKQTEEWKNVEAARRAANGGRNRAFAIWVFEDYTKRFPGQFDDELKQEVEFHLDRLWWERIKALLEERNDARMVIEKKRADIADEKPESDFIAKFEKEIEQQQNRIDKVNDELKEQMGYAGEEVPNLLDRNQLARLRGARSKDLYDVWSKRVHGHIVRNNGKAPWERG